jgi:hypothetical protein
MASGILGTADLSAATATTVYTVPSGKVASCTISICNRNSYGSIKVRVALAASGTPSASEYIEYDTNIGPNQVLERTGMVMDATKRVVVYSDTASVSAVVVGYEG